MLTRASKWVKNHTLKQVSLLAATPQRGFKMARTILGNIVVREVADDETGVVSYEVVEGLVELKLSLGKGTGTDKVVYIKDMIHTLDYKGCDLNDLLDSAANADTISLQNSVWRGLGSAVKDENGKTTNMKDYYNRTIVRAPRDPMKAIDSMDDAALAALIAKATARLNK